MRSRRSVPMPATSVSRSPWRSSTSSASVPKRATMRFASAGPTPFTSRDARKRSMPAAVLGATEWNEVTSKRGPWRR